jgi:hypothetical protein
MRSACGRELAGSLSRDLVNNYHAISALQQMREAATLMNNALRDAQRGDLPGARKISGNSTSHARPSWRELHGAGAQFMPARRVRPSWWRSTIVSGFRRARGGGVALRRCGSRNRPAGDEAAALLRCSTPSRRSRGATRPAGATNARRVSNNSRRRRSACSCRDRRRGVVVDGLRRVADGGGAACADQGAHGLGGGPRRRRLDRDGAGDLARRTRQLARAFNTMAGEAPRLPRGDAAKVAARAAHDGGDADLGPGSGLRGRPRGHHAKCAIPPPRRWGLRSFRPPIAEPLAGACSRRASTICRVTTRRSSRSVGATTCRASSRSVTSSRISGARRSCCRMSRSSGCWMTPRAISSAP